MVVQRYPEDVFVTSTQDGFCDLLDWLEFLNAKEYLVALLRGTHGLSESEAVRRAVEITPHVRMATAYIRQSLDGPTEISFLPAYYAILNLMKVYVLLGPRHADLAQNRWHGAAYDPRGKGSRSILTEEIVLKTGGVFPLFYETLTARKLPSRNVVLRIGDFLGLVSGIWFEYSLAMGRPHSICQLKFDVVNLQGSMHIRCVVTPPAGRGPEGPIQALRRFTVDSKQKRFYYSPVLQGPGPIEFTSALRGCLQTHLIYRLEPLNTYAEVVKSRLEFPQELPIALLFFYMSCIVRYRPEYFARLRDSKFWPVISSARMHAFLEFLLCFWSFAHKRNYYRNASLYNAQVALDPFQQVLIQSRNAVPTKPVEAAVAQAKGPGAGAATTELGASGSSAEPVTPALSETSPAAT